MIMSVKSSSSAAPAQSNGEIIRQGVLKKLKTMKKKYFILRAETPECLARLEYYDAERKFKQNTPPKRSIPLKTCFNINKRTDTKQKHVIALYTKDDCFCIVLDNEEELASWLKDMLRLQLEGTSSMPTGQQPKPKFEYVWQVKLCSRGLGYGRIGPYRLCLTDKTLTLVKMDAPISIDVPLASIRGCGNLKNFFYMEIGRSHCLGPGEIWIEAEDGNIAFNMHTTVSHRFRICKAQAQKDNQRNQVSDTPNGRIRSSSATEPTATAGTATKKQGPNGKNNQNGEDSESSTSTIKASATTSINYGLRERCDSMPSRPRTSSEGNHPGAPNYNKPYLIPHRSHMRDALHNSPTGSPMSPPSESTGSSYNSINDEHDSMDVEPHQKLHYPLTPSDAPIAEEDWPESPRTAVECDNYVHMENQNTTNCYADMSMSPHLGGLTMVSNSESMSSVTSGTPSTDMRFHDYQSRLDKVFSYVATEEGDDNRTERAYSVGSKPTEPSVQQTINTENSRIRAFSVGSKQTKRQIRVLPPSHHPPHDVKSNSAPMLTNTRAASSYSIGPMDDLMEMDFSKPLGVTRSRTNTNTSSGSNEGKPSSNQKSSKNIISSLLESLTGHNKTPPGYVEMAPKNKRKCESSYVDMTQGQINISSSDYSYMDMSRAGKPSQSQPDSAYMDMTSSSPVKNHTDLLTNDFAMHVSDLSTNKHNEYVDMEQNRKRTSSNNSNASSHRIAASPGYKWNADYLDMTGRNNRHSFSSQISTSPQNLDSISPKHTEWQFSRLHPLHNDHLEGYVDMTPGNGQAKRHSIPTSTSEDYMEMGGDGNQKKNRSQPISIQTTYNSNQVIKNSSPITITSLLSGRKLSPTTGTPPKFHLPLTLYTTSSPYSSLPRTKARKDSYSKDSSSSSVTTPSNSSTMFPLSLNSPSSPGSSKTNTPTAVAGSKVPASILNVANKVGGTKVCDDYAMMEFDSTKPSKQTKDDYMSFQPGRDVSMQPMQKSTTLPRTWKSGMVSPLTGSFSHMEVSEMKNVFQPISEKDERMASPKVADQVPSKLPQYHENLEKANAMEEDPYMILQASTSSYVCMAPLRNSTSRAAPMSSSGRADTSTARLHYASLDLPKSEESEGKSPRSLKNSSSEVNLNQSTTFVYADIDFVKSDDLKKSNSKCSSAVSPGLSSSAVIKP